MRQTRLGAIDERTAEEIELLADITALKQKVREEILAVRQDIEDPESEMLLTNLKRLFRHRMQRVVDARKDGSEEREAPFRTSRDTDIHELFRWWKGSGMHHRRELQQSYSFHYPGIRGTAMGRIENSLAHTSIRTLGDLRDLFTSETGDRFNPIWLAYYLSQKRPQRPGTTSQVQHGEIQMSRLDSDYLNAHAETLLACLEYIGAINMDLQWLIPPKPPALDPTLRQVEDVADGGR